MLNFNRKEKSVFVTHPLYSMYLYMQTATPMATKAQYQLDINIRVTHNANPRRERILKQINSYLQSYSQTEDYLSFTPFKQTLRCNVFMVSVIIFYYLLIINHSHCKYMHECCGKQGLQLKKENMSIMIFGISPSYSLYIFLELLYQW